MKSNLVGYDPSAPAQRGTIFGLPHSLEEAEVVIFPVPWEATVSYHSGTSFGPKAILDASLQLDLNLPLREDSPWKRGIWLHPIDGKIKSKSDILRQQIEPYIDSLEKGETYPGTNELLGKINKATSSLRSTVHEKTLELLKQGKLIGLLGGDHSCPLGFLDTLSDEFDEFGILQIDAHMDLRKSYEGFKHSHASIMYNAMKLENMSRLVQVGIRDFCEEEVQFANAHSGRIETFYDQVIHDRLFDGELWKTISSEVVDALPENVHLSVDIDGLNPQLCPGTGTPVPGGLNFNQLIHLINLVKSSGRKIIGFDLCEVAPQPYDQQWNANVGARLLYHLCDVIG